MAKTALVTGASGGIGQAVAAELASIGFDIGIHYNSNEAKAIETKHIVESYGQKALLLKADLKSSEECSFIVQKCIDELGGIYALVNNAGITKDGLAMRMSDDDFTEVIAANLNSCFYMTRAALPHLLKKREGRIVNISSVIGLTGNAGQANYAASKAGIIGFTKSIAKEAASRNICVNAVAPGYIVTPMTETLNDKVKETIQEKIPLKRLGTPEDAANIVGFLCSEKAGYITGQVICVDGGMII
ncbi:MAG: 3-oxoacyl-[acyl-carrier-protein] reductase [Clostridia bacterium]|nr:3-oxoacyl-[acyl-carrier-protein] reductase [Clostridia bacterium]